MKTKMPPARVRWVRGRNGVAAWVIPVTTYRMDKGIKKPPRDVMAWGFL
ncbi:hypothetical protein PSI23_21205 [Xenorhabdus sp. XENO-10]|uniref:Uncharacterized protein n=1 Tax=Xenorhabdus yunnanensis TaxID=3025878 RepID=A0ABT5LKT5_9GAMM|nr:hypothetical protein [Xenorhabdus yunnanensis]MDC9591728.1 hypothetical protein [Xenorhabdus yunnanensis]